jgi:hypothetical protein
MMPDNNDHRRLGVAVAALLHDGVPLGLGDARLGRGWYPAEPGWRWTDGDATLDCGNAMELEVRLLPLARYWADDAAGKLRALN